MEGINKSLVKQIKGLFDEIGFYITEDNPDVIISVNSINYTIMKYYSKFRDKIIINVTADGSSVIPITKENLGGSFIAGFLADVIGSNLILTTTTSLKGLYSVEEFSWLNGLTILNYDPKFAKAINNKLVKNGNINVYANDNDNKYIMYEGYNIVKEESNADIIITDTDNFRNFSHDKLILSPAGIYIGLRYMPSTPLEVLIYTIKMTLKSIYILNNRVDYIVVPNTLQYDRKVQELVRYYSSTVIYVDDSDYEQSCNTLLNKLGVRILLKESKRAFGTFTCLGMKNP